MRLFLDQLSRYLGSYLSWLIRRKKLDNIRQKMGKNGSAAPLRMQVATQSCAPGYVQLNSADGWANQQPAKYSAALCCVTCSLHSLLLFMNITRETRLRRQNIRRISITSRFLLVRCNPFGWLRPTSPAHRSIRRLRD